MTRVMWLNGAFGAGKSTTAIHVMAADPTWHMYDPEWVGYMLKANLHGVKIDDFQDLRAWRTLVPAVAREVATAVGRDLLAVQTVMKKDYWDELRAGLVSNGLDVVHVLLDVDEESLRSRIVGDMEDADAAGWRLGHVEEFMASRRWLLDSADIVVDTVGLSPEEVATAIRTRIGGGAARSL